MPEIKRPKTTDEILREMEQMSQGLSQDEPAKASTSPQPKGEGGALKSLLGFFIKVHDDDQENALKGVATPVTQPPSGKSEKLPPGPASAGMKGAPSTPTTPITGEKGGSRRMGDLAQGEPVPKFTPPKANQQIDLSTKPFEEIYREAGLAKTTTPVEELSTLIDSPTVANQPLAIKVVAVNLALSAKGTPLEDYIADAVRKDRALDGYQKMLSDRAREIEEKTKSEVERIQKEVEEYLKQKQAEIEKLRAQATEAGRQAIEFSIRRQGEEQRLADIVSPFLEGKPNPVTIGNNPDESPAGKA
ncbi:MAG: hypothetical protein AB1489_30880 [Acidobacteriota bacterium]